MTAISDDENLQAKMEFIKAFFDDLDSKIAFLDKLYSNGHQDEAQVLCSCYIDWLASALYWPEEQNNFNNLIAYGSGFISDPDGIIATNYHVISALFKNPDTAIAIRMENGEFVKAQKILSLDKTNDVVLIKVEGKGLPSLKLSNDYKPRQGEDVFVIGSPFGFETTITNGIISSIRGTDEFLQITAPISPGSSGSPVFNANGDVIGIATLIMQGGQNLNFAIPVKYITKMDKNLQITKTEPLKSTIPSSVINPKAESNTKNYEEHIQLAKEYVKKDQWNDAVDEYTKAISIKPDNAYLYFGRGEASRDLRISLSDYSKAIALQPDNVAFYYYRANIYKGKEE